VGWTRRFILFHNQKHPKEMAEKEVRQFISGLAVNAKISASTQTVALSTRLFLCQRLSQQSDCSLEASSGQVTRWGKAQPIEAG